MLKFEKPDYKVKEYVKDSFYGKFELEPLERGFGTTLGNALRRVMSVSYTHLTLPTICSV